MKYNEIHKIVYQQEKVIVFGRPKEYESTFKPSLMSDSKLKKELCGPSHSYKQCRACENIGWCEYGNEAVRRSKKARVL